MQMRKQIIAIFTAVVSAVAGYAGTVSLDGTWQAEPAPEARGDVPPAAFTHAIPVPGHWPLMSPAAAPGDICAETFEMSAPYGGEARRRVTVRVPADAKGTIKVCASLPEGTSSERRWKVLDRKPGLEASAKAVASSELNIRPACFLLDGSPLTRWESKPGDKKPWVEIDLGEEREVTSCKIHWFGGWKGPPSKWCVTPALPARTRYIFVKISDMSPNKLASIEEIEIH